MSKARLKMRKMILMMSNFLQRRRMIKRRNNQQTTNSRTKMRLNRIKKNNKRVNQAKNQYKLLSKKTSPIMQKQVGWENKGLRLKNDDL